jgi:hypothetical protein
LVSNTLSAARPAALPLARIGVSPTCMLSNPIRAALGQGPGGPLRWHWLIAGTTTARLRALACPEAGAATIPGLQARTRRLSGGATRAA